MFYNIGFSHEHKNSSIKLEFTALFSSVGHLASLPEHDLHVRMLAVEASCLVERCQPRFVRRIDNKLGAMKDRYLIDKFVFTCRIVLKLIITTNSYDCIDSGELGDR